MFWVVRCTLSLIYQVSTRQRVGCGLESSIPAFVKRHLLSTQRLGLCLSLPLQVSLYIFTEDYAQQAWNST